MTQLRMIADFSIPHTAWAEVRMNAILPARHLLLAMEARIVLQAGRSRGFGPACARARIVFDMPVVEGIEAQAICVEIKEALDRACPMADTALVRAARRIETLPPVIDHGEILRAARQADIEPDPTDYPVFIPEPDERGPFFDQVFLQDGHWWWAEDKALGDFLSGPAAGPDPLALYEEVARAA